MRRWRESDREPFAAMNVDPRVMEFFPGLQDRATSDASVDYWTECFDERGWSNWAVDLKDSGEFIGFIGLWIPKRKFPFSPCVEIGWRLAHAHWGRGYATEGALASLAAGFDRLGLDEIVSYTTLHNLRSRAVMEKIGMHDANADFEHPALPEGHPLRMHCLYRITREEFRSETGKPAARTDARPARS